MGRWGSARRATRKSGAEGSGSPEERIEGTMIGKVRSGFKFYCPDRKADLLHAAPFQARTLSVRVGSTAAVWGRPGERRLSALSAGLAR